MHKEAISYPGADPDFSLPQLSLGTEVRHDSAFVDGIACELI
jgi:hypothetical protein